jgi:hypothetical protein
VSDDALLAALLGALAVAVLIAGVGFLRALFRALL